MLGAVPSGTAAISDVIVVLIYLAAFGTSILIFVSRLRARHRRKKATPAATAEDGWTSLLAPMGSQGWTAPTRSTRPAPRERVAAGTSLSRPNPVRPESAPGGPVIDLRSEPIGTGSPAVPAVVGGRGNRDDGTRVDPAPVTTLAPPKPQLDEPFVTILGPPGVIGWAEKPDRRILTELAVYLALHRERPVSTEKLLEVLWPPTDDRAGAGPDVNTVHQAVARLRRCLGADSVPDAVTTGGYLLAATVPCDWDRFRELVDEATAATDPKPALRQALMLVNGPPFAELRKDSFQWVWSELLASTVTARVVDAANRLAERALADRDVETAEWAACKGLDASPTEELLMEDRLRAALAARDAARMERVWDEAHRTLGAQADSGPVGATYRRVRDELRGST